MEYRVVPFTANVANHEGSTAAATQLEHLIATHAAEGWDYLRLEQVETNIAGSSGCFGLGATQPRTISASMAVFRR